ncbi:MAG: alpha-amylase family glycosyl hydrolase, partial [Candidatus Limnocylindrales bacterium]
DVMDNLSHKFMRMIRDAAKAADPNALIIGEKWDDASAFLLGDQADTTMNYRFRRAVIGLVNGDTADLDGAIAGLTPTQFRERMLGVKEDYPAPAWETLLNLVDSHDTTRILWTLAPGKDDPAVKESADGLAVANAKLKIVSAIQLTWPGIADIYYGDEVGLTGHDDPDDRRPYPWANIGGIRDWYRTLGTARAAHESLRSGDLEFILADDAAGTLGYVRRTDNEASVVALNIGSEDRTLDLDVTGRIPDGTILTDVIAGGTATVGGGHVSVALGPLGASVLVTPAGTDLAAPAAPAGLTATASDHGVELAWTAATDAATYDVYRSFLTQGGYELVGSSPSASYVDATARFGSRSYYVIVARDAADNGSARSNESDVLPELVLSDARLTGPATVSQPLSAIDPGTAIEALVKAGAATTTTGPAIGLRAQLGVGDAKATTPATDYRWFEMAWSADAADAERFAGTVRPEAQGSYNVALRVSTDGGATWSYADRGGIVAAPDAPWSYRADQAVALSVVPNADTAAPASPANLRIAAAGDTAVTLAWDASPDADLFRYEIGRSAAPGGPYEPIGTSVEPGFTDASIRAGDSYVYVVTAVDGAFNRSAASDEVAAAAVSRAVQVTFTVTVPATTPKADTIYIAGGFQGWDPAATPMTKVNDTTWTITVPFTEGDKPEYKFTRGSWDAVEKDDGCGEIPNRTFEVSFGDAGALPVADTVAKWRDVDQCG